VRRLPGPAIRPLGEGDQTSEAHHELFRDWQRTQTQSSATALRSSRLQMDVWFCLMRELSEQESSAERHCCVEADPDQTNCAPSRSFRSQCSGFVAVYDTPTSGKPSPYRGYDEFPFAWLPIRHRSTGRQLLGYKNCF